MRFERECNVPGHEVEGLVRCVVLLEFNCHVLNLGPHVGDLVLTWFDHRLSGVVVGRVVGLMSG